jgi:TonB-dependent starch-binding outer membrane protein SusC
MLSGRAGLEFTYYNQRTDDALIPVPDPPSSGFSNEHLENIGTISNTGFEILLTATPIYSRNFVWDASLSLATNNNKLVSFNGARDEISFGAFATVQKHIAGYPLGGYWGQDVVRDASGNPVVDASGDVTVDTTYVYMGPSMPPREASFTSTFTFLGNLRLYANFDYKGGHQLWCAICSIRNRIDQNTWEVNNPDADPVDVAVYKSLQTMAWIYPADFIKWRELSLTYTLPASWGAFFSDSRWSFTLSGRNLFVWTKYKGTGDPEVNFYSTGSASTFNRLDYASLPQTRRLAASVRVGF